MQMQKPSNHSRRRLVEKIQENTSIQFYLDTQKQVVTYFDAQMQQLVEATSNLQLPKVGGGVGVVQLGSQHIHTPVLPVQPQVVDPPRRSSAGAIASPPRKVQKPEQGSCMLHQMAHQQGCLHQQ